MSILKLVEPWDKVLYQQAEEVTPSHIADPRFKRFMDSMWDTMYAMKGIGLAAPQVGQGVRIVIVNVGGFSAILINPMIINSSKQTNKMEEGCLSYPGKKVIVERPKRVTVAYMDGLCVEKKIKLSGLAGRCVQHGIDHLNGVTLKTREKI